MTPSTPIDTPSRSIKISEITGSPRSSPEPRSPSLSSRSQSAGPLSSRSSTSSPRLQRKESSFLRLFRLITFQNEPVAPIPQSLEQGIQQRLIDYMQIPPALTAKQQVIYAREEALKAKNNLFKLLLQACPSITLTPSQAQNSHSICLRVCNNYLLTPDVETTRVKSKSATTHDQITYVKKFTYHGTTYRPLLHDKMRKSTAATLTSSGQISLQAGSEINCDYGASTNCLGITVMALADGCGLGIKAQTAAIYAVDVAINTFCEFVKAKHPTTVQEVEEYQLLAFDRVQDTLKRELVKTSNTTLQLAVLIDNLFITTALGDTKALITRKKQDHQIHCYDPLDRQPFLADSERDPGGYLGAGATVIVDKDGALEGADLRNLRVGVIKTEPGDIVHLLTDGTHACFDPVYQGSSPHDIDPSLAYTTWDDTIPSLFALRQKHIRESFARCIANCQNERDVAVTLDAYVERVTAPHKLALITGTNPIPPGKPDHANSIHVLI